MRIDEQLSAQNILIIPYYVDGFESKGFEKMSWEEQGNIGSPVGAEAWGDYLAEELDAAAAQSRMSLDELKAKGVVIVANKKGKIVRRGLGVPEWPDVFADLNPASNKKKETAVALPQSQGR